MKTQRREIVLPIINLITKICAERNTTFNALAGSAGRLYFNGDGVALENAQDFANMYQIISNMQLFCHGRYDDYLYMILKRMCMCSRIFF